MGALIYGSRVSELEIEDRTLAHLQFVVATKLRRNEQFMLTWNHGVERGSGRSAIWISPYIQPCVAGGPARRRQQSGGAAPHPRVQCGSSRMTGAHPRIRENGDPA